MRFTQSHMATVGSAETLRGSVMLRSGSRCWLARSVLTTAKTLGLGAAATWGMRLPMLWISHGGCRIGEGKQERQGTRCSTAARLIQKQESLQPEHRTCMPP